jgi:carboxyl-terminal processing protease
VELSIERPGLPTLLRVKIKRAFVTLPTVDTQLLPGNFAYIRIHSFEASTVGERFRYIYERWVKVGARGIVVDLRSNPGGQLSQAVEVAQALGPRGPIVHIQDLSSGSKVTIDTLPHSPGPPLAVLVDEGTASAAEIVAAAVKENGAGVVVGRKTFGKGSVQTIIPLPVGGALRLTTARYLTPEGNSLDGRGLEPDVEVPATPLAGHSFPEMGKRTLRRGMVGLDVLGLQERLSFLGYDPGPLDGIFGRRTALALARFQREEGVQGEQWGVASGPTFSALESAVRRKLEALARDGSDLILERALGVLKERAAR